MVARSAVVRRPCTFPASARASSSDSATTHDIPAASTASARCSTAGGHGTATNASRGALVVGEAARAEWHSRTDDLRHSTFERGAPAPPRRDRVRRSPGATGSPIASNTVCQPVHRHRCAASARSTSSFRVLPLASSAAARTTIPGVQNPHCDPPVATNASASAAPDRRVEAVDGRDRSPRDPRGRGDARDPRIAVDEHGATATLTLRRAAVFDRDDAELLPQHREERLAGPGTHFDLFTVTRELDPIRHDDLRRAG